MTEAELEAVRLRAYEIWDRDGRPYGRHEEHWRMALAELELARLHFTRRQAIAAQTRNWDVGEEDQ